MIMLLSMRSSEKTNLKFHIKGNLVNNNNKKKICFRIFENYRLLALALKRTSM